MIRKGILASLLVLVTIASITLVSKDEQVSSITQRLNTHFQVTTNNVQEEYGMIEIPKISLKQRLYPIGDRENNVDQHVTILKDSILPSEENSRLILAAHSGNASNSYFTKLEHVKVGDLIQITIENKSYQYQVRTSYLEKKTGKIHVSDQWIDSLILTTCSETEIDQQFVIIATKIEG